MTYTIHTALARTLGRRFRHITDAAEQEGYREAIEAVIIALREKDTRFDAEGFLDAIQRAALSIR